MEFVIYNQQERLYWNNDEGWGYNPTLFTKKEKETLNLPIGGEWHAFTERWCRVCNTPLMFEFDTELIQTYPYFCPQCDENMFEIEARKEWK